LAPPGKHNLNATIRLSLAKDATGISPFSFPQLSKPKAYQYLRIKKYIYARIMHRPGLGWWISTEKKEY
jgi:hypothetical protein